jgi:hypothetical protein
MTVWGKVVRSGWSFMGASDLRVPPALSAAAPNCWVVDARWMRTDTTGASGATPLLASGLSCPVMGLLSPRLYGYVCPLPSARVFCTVDQQALTTVVRLWPWQHQALANSTA